VVVGGRTHRLAQTLLALLGTEVLLSPLTLALAAGVSATTPADPLGLVARVGLIGVLIWNVLIVAHVMRSVFESTLATGVLVAVACALLAYGFSDLWFGSTPATGG